MKPHYRNRRDGKVFWGILIALLGGLFLLRKLDILPHFSFHLTWPYILIIIGLLIGVRNGFRNHAWWILILIGGLNLAHVRDFPIIAAKGIYASDLIWPLILIIAGLYIAFKPRKKWSKYRDCPPYITPSITTDENKLSIDVVFGGRKEIVTSKNFQGGVIRATFGGAEINMMQADSIQPMEMELKVTFGGVELIVPSHWELQNEIVPSFGAVEDHRIMRTLNAGEEKRVLVLRGSVVFGNVEIKSY